MQIVFALERENLVEIAALVPQLKFARCIAGVGATLEHRDEHNFDVDRFGGGLRGSTGSAGGEQQYRRNQGQIL